jgi:hypothetical protein
MHHHPRSNARSARRVTTLGAITGFALLMAVGGQPGPAGAEARTERRPDHATYVHRADTICRTTVDRTDAIVEDLGFTPSDAEARQAAREIVRLARTEVRKLRALTPPRGDTREVATIYDAVDHGFDRIEAKPRRLFHEPGPLARATRLAKAYGLEVCGRG